MKVTKRVFSLLLGLVILLSLCPTAVFAAEKDKIPEKVRLFSGWDERAIEISLADPTQSIDNIKTDNKNLFAMLTGSEYISEQGNNANDSNKNSFSIGLRSEKNGTYTLSFDIVDKNDKKISSKEIIVYAYEAPVKRITFNGKALGGNELTGKSAKVKVALTAGNTIKKLEYGVYKIQEENNSTQSDIVYKTFKNGAEVAFGTKAYFYSNQYSNENDGYIYESRYFNTGMTCPTYIKITYYDKYTKQNETYEEYFFTLVK